MNKTSELPADIPRDIFETACLALYGHAPDKFVRDNVVLISRCARAIMADRASRPAPEPQPEVAAELANLQALVDLVAADVLGPTVANDPDDDSVGWNDSGPLPMTFGHVRRAQAALRTLSTPPVVGEAVKAEISRDDLAEIISKAGAPPGPPSTPVAMWPENHFLRVQAYKQADAVLAVLPPVVEEAVKADQITDEMVERAAEVFWNDIYGARAGAWDNPPPDSIAGIQFRATARGALLSALSSGDAS